MAALLSGSDRAAWELSSCTLRLSKASTGQPEVAAACPWLRLLVLLAAALVPCCLGSCFAGPRLRTCLLAAAVAPLLYFPEALLLLLAGRALGCAAAAVLSLALVLLPPLVLMLLLLGPSPDCKTLAPSLLLVVLRCCGDCSLATLLLSLRCAGLVAAAVAAASTAAGAEAAAVRANAPWRLLPLLLLGLLRAPGAAVPASEDVRMGLPSTPLVLEKRRVPDVLACLNAFPAGWGLCWALSQCRAVARAETASWMSAAALVASFTTSTACGAVLRCPADASGLHAADTRDTLASAKRSSWPAASDSRDNSAGLAEATSRNDGDLVITDMYTVAGVHADWSVCYMCQLLQYCTNA